MKNLIRPSYVIVIAAAALFAGCKSKKQAMPTGEHEVAVLCSGPDYFTNKDFFRANSIGESRDQVIAKEKALTSARGQLAASVQTTVKSVTDNYLNSRTLNNKEDAEAKFEQLNRNIVEQTLAGIKTICEKPTQTADGNYKYYIAIELSASDLVSKYNEQLSKDDKLKIDYDYQKFKDTFDAEMQKAATKN